MSIARPAPGDTLDLGDPELYQTTRRYQIWADFVAQDRAVWSPPGASPNGFWSVFSHAACTALLAPGAPFTSQYGMMIGFDRDRPDKAGGAMLVATDGERHDRLRRLIRPFLSRASAVALHGFIRREIEQITNVMRDNGRIDVAAQIGPRLPAAVVCELLGIPETDRDLVVRLTNHAFGGSEPAMANMSPSEAHAEILSYFVDVIMARRANPGQDLVSALLADGTLSDIDILMNCDNVLIGGNETTRHAVTGCFHAVAEEPDILSAMRAQPGLIPAAVEEVMRWTSPAMHVLRVATSATTIAQQEVPKGAAVVAWLPAANRDPRVFPHPERLRLDREVNRHLAFGNGLHHCLGAALARAELAALLQAICMDIKTVDLTDAPRWMSVNQVQAYRQLSVELHWR